MFGKLRNRGTRFIYLSMLILTLSGAAMMATPGPASAQMTTNPANDPRCMWNGGYICREVLSSSTVERFVTTAQECNLGWSSRKATQDVTTTTVVRVEQVLVEQYYWTFSFPGYWNLTSSTIVTEETIIDTRVEKTDCRPVTGRPPQN